jgi:hypothetical protein
MIDHKLVPQRTASAKPSARARSTSTMARFRHVRGQRSAMVPRRVRASWRTWPSSARRLVMVLVGVLSSREFVSTVLVNETPDERDRTAHPAAYSRSTSSEIRRPGDSSSQVRTGFRVVRSLRHTGRPAVAETGRPGVLDTGGVRLQAVPLPSTPRRSASMLRTRANAPTTSWGDAPRGSRAGPNDIWTYPSTAAAGHLGRRQLVRPGSLPAQVEECCRNEVRGVQQSQVVRGNLSERPTGCSQVFELDEVLW